MLTHAEASKPAERLAQVEQELAEKQQDFEKERERVVKTETEVEVLQAQVHHTHCCSIKASKASKASTFLWKQVLSYAARRAAGAGAPPVLLYE